MYKVLVVLCQIKQIFYFYNHWNTEYTVNNYFLWLEIQTDGRLVLA